MMMMMMMKMKMKDDDGDEEFLGHLVQTEASPLHCRFMLQILDRLVAMRTKSDKEAKLNLDQLKAPECWRCLLLLPISPIQLAHRKSMEPHLWSSWMMFESIPWWRPVIYSPCESRWRALSRASKTENFPAAKGSRLNVAVMCASISWSGGLLQRVRRHSGRAKESMEAEVRPVPSCSLRRMPITSS